MFFYGTLCHLPLLDLVLAGERYRTRPATLSGHRISWVKDQPFPTIQEDADATAHGLLVEGLSDTARARLDFYEGGFDYALKEVAVKPDGTTDTVTAEVYFPAPGLWTSGAPWSLDDWVAQWGEMTLEAADEVMSYFGKVSAQVVAQRFPMIRTRAASRVRARASTAPTTLRADFGAGDIDVHASARPYAGFFTMEEQDLAFRRYSGEMSEVVNRAAFVGGDAVIVLPYDPARDRVMLVEQFRMGPHMRGDPHPWTLEPIAGRVDAGETPEDTAHREAREETGLTLDRLIDLPHHYPSPGSNTEYFYTFVALCDLPDDVAGVGGAEAEAEDIRSHVIPFDHLMALVASGEAACGPLVLCALWLSLNREAVRRRS
ncbi:NUDIX domain-containing protein [Aliiroseovarius sp. S2029]|uniref:NUDIX domain-containing protein n=1 Tax=Aliiroseovarius sp. S2029 TaxID=2936988 RepID=UPI0020BE24F2|nr:NUDIX domain-containing protein [Aliiroseovarius sp. S2029]MCK8484919.1 NUDIX domain-containing protein [Aliiroseovarius sp. S2029]